MDNKGQSALFDSFLFLAIMLIASSLLLLYTTTSFQVEEVLSRQEGIEYVESTRTALLHSTLKEAWYYNATGDVVFVENGSSIEDLLLEELYLLDDGLSLENFEGYNSEINILARALVRDGFHYALYGLYSDASRGEEVSLLISDILSKAEDIPTSYFSSSWTYPMIGGKGGEATIILYLWRA